ncbi:unnamed protein product, partial [Chrysoparadoxa australica]
QGWPRRVRPLSMRFPLSVAMWAIIAPRLTTALRVALPIRGAATCATRSGANLHGRGARRSWLGWGNTVGRNRGLHGSMLVTRMGESNED